MADQSYLAHPTAEVARDAVIGAGTKIWRQSQIMPAARIGEHRKLGKCVYVDFGRDDREPGQDPELHLGLQRRDRGGRRAAGAAHGLHQRPRSAHPQRQQRDAVNARESRRLDRCECHDRLRRGARKLLDRWGAAT